MAVKLEQLKRKETKRKWRKPKGDEDERIDKYDVLHGRVGRKGGWCGMVKPICGINHHAFCIALLFELRLCPAMRCCNGLNPY